MMLTFEAGPRVIYKPKNMSLESHLPAINHWLAAEGSEIVFRFPKCLGNRAYGWAEVIQQQECRSEQEVREFYHHAGHFLGLAYFLNATDLSYESLVASGPWPVPIDLETFFYPEMRPFPGAVHAAAESKPDPPARPAGHGSLDLLGKFALPSKLRFYGAFWLERGRAPRPKACLEHPNTDEMHPEYVAVPARQAQNQVFLNGQRQTPAQFQKELAAGFSEFFDFVVSKKPSFLSFIETFADADTRLLFRPSQLYASLIRRSLHLDYLESGVHRSFSLEQLYRPPLKGGYLSAGLRRIIDHEINAILQNDVPRFYVPLTSKTRSAMAGCDFSALLWESPLETVRRRIESASYTAKSYHSEVIRESLSRKPQRVSCPVNDERLFELGSKIVCRLMQSAHRDGEYLWNLPSFCDWGVSRAERQGIYSGDLGALLAVAAANCVSGSKRYAEFLHEHELRFRELGKRGREYPLGIGHGAGAIIFGTTLLSCLTGERQWLETALQVAERLEESTIRESPESDLIWSSAGLLVAMSRLYQVSQHEVPLQKGRICVEALTNRFRDDVGWRDPNGWSALGLAHGSAGIAFAAAGFASQTRCEKAKELAVKALQFDRRFYLNRENNWPVLAREQNASMSAWCAGLPGMLLARLAVAEISDHPRLLDEIHRILRNFPEQSGLDFWCCGALGLAEVLLFAATRLQRPDLQTKAQTMLSSIIERALPTCYFRLSRSAAENYCFQPSLFRGFSGVAYSALRFGSSGKIPSILAFEIGAN